MEPWYICTRLHGVTTEKKNHLQTVCVPLLLDKKKNWDENFLKVKTGYILRNFHIRTVQNLDIIKVLFIHQPMH